MSSQAYARRVQAQAIAVPQPRTFAVTGLGLEGWRPFGIAAAAAVLVSVLFVEWTANRWISDEATIALDDIGEAVAAFIAAGSCALAATRNTGRTRWAWSFFAASAFSWALGEVVWSYFEVGRGIEVPFPSAADAGYLLAIPFALLGVFAFTSAPTRLATRSETALAGSLCCSSRGRSGSARFTSPRRRLRPPRSSGSPIRSATSSSRPSWWSHCAGHAERRWGDWRCCSVDLLSTRWRTAHSRISRPTAPTALSAACLTPGG